MQEIIEFIQTGNLWFFIVTILLIGADVISGIMKGYATGTLSSSVMRTGFWHKSANVFLLVLSYATTVAHSIIPELPDNLGSVHIFVASYISIMELTSVLENLTAINPELKSTTLFERFGVSKKADKEQEQEQ